MDAASRTQIRLIIETVDERTQISLREDLRNLTAAQSAKGLLRSGSTIKRSLDLIEKHGSDFVKAIVDQVAPVAKDIEAFALMEEALLRLKPTLERSCDEMVDLACGKSVNGQMDAARREASSLFQGVKRRLSSQLNLHRYAFARISVPLEPPPPPLALPMTVTPPEIARNPGGKPRSEHWDDMWAEIAVRLYTGDIKPKSQADIVRAMQTWFYDQDINMGDTAIIERARRLWRKLQAVE